MGLINRLVTTILMTPEEAQKERHHRDNIRLELEKIQSRENVAHISGQYAHELETQRGINNDRNTKIRIHEENIAKQEQMVLQSNLDIKTMLADYEIKKKLSMQDHHQAMELETHKHNLKKSENESVSKRELEEFMRKNNGYRPDDDY